MVVSQKIVIEFMVDLGSDTLIASFQSIAHGRMFDNASSSMVGIKAVWVSEEKCPTTGLTREDFAGFGVDNVLFEREMLWGFVLVVINFDEILKSSLIADIEEDSDYHHILQKVEQDGKRTLIWRSFRPDDPRDEMITDEETEVHVALNMSRSTQWILGTVYKGGWRAATKSQYFQNVTDMQIVIIVLTALVGTLSQNAIVSMCRWMFAEEEGTRKQEWGIQGLWGESLRMDIRWCLSHCTCAVD